MKEDPSPESRGTEQESQRGPFVVGSPRFGWRFWFFWRGPAGLAGTVHVEVGASRQQQLTTTELVAAALFRQGRRRRGYGGLSGAPIRRSEDFGSRCEFLSHPPTRGYWLLLSDNWTSLLLTGCWPSTPHRQGSKLVMAGRRPVHATGNWGTRTS